MAKRDFIRAWTDAIRTMPMGEQREVELQAKDLQELPTSYLLRVDLAEFARILREEDPNQEQLTELDAVLRQHVFYAVRTVQNAPAMRQKVDEFRHLVPHARRDALNAGEKPWASRWEALADTLDAAAEILKNGSD